MTVEQLVNLLQTHARELPVYIASEDGFREGLVLCVGESDGGGEIIARQDNTAAELRDARQA